MTQKERTDSLKWGYTERVIQNDEYRGHLHFILKRLFNFDMNNKKTFLNNPVRL